MNTFNILLSGNLQAGDYIGFTFFTGYMSMLAASIFFIVERGQVTDKWKTSLTVSALITFIAAVHYFYMRGVWLDTGTSPAWRLPLKRMLNVFILIIVLDNLMDFI